MTDTYPLSWPPGWPRTASDDVEDGRYNFRKLSGNRMSPTRFWTFAEARDALLDEMRRLKARDVVLSSNFKPDRLGRIVEPSRRPPDQGIAIYFTVDGRPKTMARDKYVRAEENMRSLTLTIEALRAIERHGGGLMMDRAFEGFTALPPPLVTPARRPWYEVLGVSPNATESEIQAAYRAKAKAAHPDAGGSVASMSDINQAREEGLRSRAA